MTIVLRFLSIKKSQSIIRISKTRKYDDFFNVESVDRIINYPKSSRKSEIEEKWLFLKKIGSFWAVLVQYGTQWKNSCSLNFEILFARALSLGTIFWVSGSEFSIWGTSRGPHRGCVNATKLEMVSVHFFCCCFWWGYWWGSRPEDNISGRNI